MTIQDTTAIPDKITLSSPLESRMSGGPESRTSWVLALPEGRLVYKGEPVQITGEYLHLVASETRKAIYAWADRAQAAGTTPFRPPVIREHAWAGERYGDVLDAKVASGPEGRDALWVKVAWSETTWDQIEAGAVAHVSVRVDGTFQDDSGEVFGPLVRELSLTASPALKAIGTIQDHISIQLSDSTYEVELSDLSFAPTGELPMEELLQQIASMLTDMSARLEGMEAHLMAPEEEPEEEAPEDGEEDAPEDVEMTSEDEEEDMALSDTQEDTPEPAPKAPEPAPAPDLFGDLLDVMRDIRDQLQAPAPTSAPARLNLSEHGSSGRPPAPRPRTEGEWMRAGRDKGLSGQALVEFVLANKS